MDKQCDFESDSDSSSLGSYLRRRRAERQAKKSSMTDPIKEKVSVTEGNNLRTTLLTLPDVDATNASNTSQGSLHNEATNFNAAVTTFAPRGISPHAFGNGGRPLLADHASVYLSRFPLHGPADVIGGSYLQPHPAMTTPSTANSTSW